MNKLSKYVGPIFIAIYLIVPISLWTSSNLSVLNHLDNTWNIAKFLGNMSATLGILLFCLNFVLATRLKIIDIIFNGLNRVYVIHHTVGALAFIFLLFHPILSLGQYLQFSIIAAFNFLVPNLNNLGIYYGVLALFITIYLLSLTFFVKLKYDKWKNTHKYMGLVLLPAFLHILSVSPTIQSNPILKYYLYVSLCVAMFSYIYKVIMVSYLNPSYMYKVVSAKNLADDIIYINLAPVSKAISYKPGQFVFVSFESIGITSEEHPFSLTSTPDSEILSLCIKSIGDYTETLKLLRTGSLARIRGGFGAFTYTNYTSSNQIWIAGGIGITPFLSMARSLTSRSVYKIVFFHLVSTFEEAIFAQEIYEISKRIPNFTYYIYSSKQMNKRIDANYIQSVIQNTKVSDIFICGPLPMMQSLRLQFRELGLKNQSIHTEEFALY